MFLRQNSVQVIVFGPFLDSTDGVTPETGLTISPADFQLSKDGAVFAQTASITNAPHDIDGWYRKGLEEADVDTVGELVLQVTISGALPVWVRWYVVEEAIYDALFAASSPGYLQPTVAARTLDVTAGGNAGIDWGNVAAPTSTVDLTNTTISDILTTQMTESYSIDGVAPTLAQALFLIQQRLGDFSISGSTITVTEIDGATTAATYALDSATNPTSSSRST